MFNLIRSKNEKGFVLIEALISIVLLGAIAAAVYGGLSVASIVSRQTDMRQSAESLARLQLEYVKKQPYNTTYTPYSFTPLSDNFDSTITVSQIPSRDNNVQKITVKISQNGAPPLATLEGEKVMP